MGQSHWRSRIAVRIIPAIPPGSDRFYDYYIMLRSSIQLIVIIKIILLFRAIVASDPYTAAATCDLLLCARRPHAYRCLVRW